MSGAKPWQLILIGVGLLGAVVCFLIFNPFVDPVEAQMARRVYLVDVSSGELFEVSTKERGIAPPLRNPETQKVSLVPVKEGENGSDWYVSSRHMALLEMVEVEVSAVEEDGKVPQAVGPPKSIKPLY